MNFELVTLNCLLILVLAVLPACAAEAAAISPQEFVVFLQEKKAVAVDVMSGIECRDHRIPGSLCVPAEEVGRRLPGIVNDKDRPLVFYGDQGTEEQIEKALGEAKGLGYSRVSFLLGGLAAWKEAGFSVESLERMPRSPGYAVSPRKFRQWQGEGKTLLILDIRSEVSFGKDHIQGAVNIPLYLLDQRYPELPLDRTIVVVDENGLRSFLAVSFLTRKGFSLPVRLRGGMEKWNAPFVKGQVR